MKGLEGKVGIVTGAGSGIGRATAVRLALGGVSVVVADIDEAGANDTTLAIKGAGGTAASLVTDVADEAQIAALIEFTVDTFGSLQLLHNNAADVQIIHDDNDIASMESAVWDRTMAVNLRGPMLGCKYAIPHMLKAGSGSIVITSSTSGQMGELDHAAYGASKAGVDSLARYVATQYGKRNIRCNSVAPGPVRTAAFEDLAPPDYKLLWEQNVLTPQIGRPEDLAEAVAFLLSDSAAYINGQRLNVDGGLSAHFPLYSSLIGAAAQPG